MPLHSSLGDREGLHLKKKKKGQTQWLTTVIPALWEAEVVGQDGDRDHLRSGVRKQPGQHGETLSLLKYKK